MCNKYVRVIISIKVYRGNSIRGFLWQIHEQVINFVKYEKNLINQL